MTPDGFTAGYGPRRYELRAIEQPERIPVESHHQGHRRPADRFLLIPWIFTSQPSSAQFS